GAFGAHGEDQGPAERSAVEVLAVARDEGGPAGVGGSEVDVQGLRAGRDGDGEAEEAAGRGAQGAGVVRMDAAGGEGEPGRAGRLGHAGESAEVPRVLEA